MKQRQFIGKFKKPTQKALAIFLVILFILSIVYFAFARGGRGGGGHRGGRGSVRHHRTARHDLDRDRDRYKQRKKHRHHQRRLNHGSVHYSNSYDHDDDYNKTSCDDYGRNCVYDYYYERCDCD